jgi:arginyl-tRNA synthetase
MKEAAEELIKKALSNLDLPEVPFVVEHTEDLSHGDYAANVAMVLAKEVGKNPKELAGTIASAIESIKDETFLSISVAGPGFINFTVGEKTLAEVINRALEEGIAFGTNDSLKGKKVIVEHTDPNPFKQFHIGHLMPNVIGSTIARLFIAQGAEVKQACYQGDVGMHVAMAVAYKIRNNISWETAEDVALSYAPGVALSKEDPEFHAYVVEVNKHIYLKDSQSINEIYTLGRKLTLDQFEVWYKKLGTSFDFYFFESTTAEFGKALVHRHPEIFSESEGAIVFEGERRDPKLHTRVFINREGLPTYEAKELGLAKLKYDTYEYDTSVVVTGNEINDYFKVLLAAMAEVFPDLARKTQHISHGMLRLPTGKMSSRTGDVILAKDLFETAEAKAREVAKEKRSDDEALLAEQVALGAIKYSILRQAIGKDVIFNFDTSITFDGDSGPYLQYTRARINSIREKAKEAGIDPISNAKDAPFDIERIVFRYPEVIKRATQELAPHIVVTYLTHLASSFNHFYATEQIVDINDPLSGRKLAVALAVGQVLENGLTLLGIPVPEKM